MRMHHHLEKQNFEISGIFSGFQDFAIKQFRLFRTAKAYSSALVLNSRNNSF
jgi:hypothetical protein